MQSHGIPYVLSWSALSATPNKDKEEKNVPPPVREILHVPHLKLT
jgi:hypothetical protein